MKLVPPFPLSTISQKFGGNAVPLYTVGLGLKGHPGIDFGVPWGTYIPAAADAYCYSTILNKDPAFYQAVYTIVDEPDVSYEISYGHCSEISAVPGQSYKQGESLGKVGNTGSVYANGIEVSESAKIAGSHAGAHLHLQVRVLKKVLVSRWENGKHYVNDGHGLYTTSDGYIYEVPDFGNGYNGCVDPAQFFENPENTPVIASPNPPVDSLPKPAPVVVSSWYMNIMKGYLTYTLAILAVAYGVLGYFIGGVDGSTSLNIIWGGLTVFGLRRAITV